MTAQHDLDRQLSAFLVDGPERLPDSSFDSVRDRTEQTRQRVVLGPWRFPEMNKLFATGLGAAAVIAALLVGPNLLPSSSSGPGGQPTQSPEPSDTAQSAEPARSPDAFLPEGPSVVYDVVATEGAPRITVTIPATGWTSVPGSGVLSKGEDGHPPESAILLWSWAAGARFDVYGDPCQWASTKPETPVTTVDAIADALAAQSSRDASDPVDVTVGGHAGRRVTLHVPNDTTTQGEAFKDCDFGKFASYGVEGGASDPARYHQGPGQIDELWILDVDGAIVIIDAAYRPDTSEARIEEMREIAESATFE